MEIGVQTKGIIESGVDIHEGFQLIRDAGFTKVDFNLDNFLKNSDIYSGKINSFFDVEIEKLIPYFEKYKEAMDAAGLSASQMHAPYPVRVPNKEKVSEYMESCVIPKSIVIAKTLGVPWVVVHPFKMQYTHGINRENTDNLEYFKVLIPLLKEQGVKICFENLYEGKANRMVEGVCANPLQANWLVDTLNAEAGEELFGMCLDTGHLQLVKRDSYEYIMAIQNRLKILHLHENDGISDVHEMPFTFGDANRRGLDWEGIAEALALIDYDGTLSFETFPCMNAFPYSTRAQVLKVIYAAGEHLAERIAYYKNR